MALKWVLGMFNPQFLKTHTDREDPRHVGQVIHNESCKLPGHDVRMDAHCERVQREYFDSELYKEEMHEHYSLGI